MPARAGEAVIDSARDAVVGPVETLLLARIACEGGATRSDLARDAGALLQHKLSPAEVRAAVDAGVAALIQRGFAIETRGRLSATEAGTEAGRQLYRSRIIAAGGLGSGP